MLHHLRVRNLGVLEDVTITPSPGLTVITGETGAGKTLLLGGIRLLTGAKPDSTMVGPFHDESVAEGLLGETDELAAARIVPRETRSRSYLNGTLVSSGALGEAVGRAIEIVGQHDQVALRNPHVVLDLIDTQLGPPGQEAAAAYRAAWVHLGEAKARAAALGGDEASLRRELDLVRFQADEIEGAGLSPGDDTKLETLGARLRNTDALRLELSETMGLLDEIDERSGEAVSRLRRAAELDPETQELAGAMEGLASQLGDISTEVRRATEALDLDPAHLEEVEAQLTALGALKRKYGRTLDEVLQFGANARARFEELESLLTGAEAIAGELMEASNLVDDAAGRLSESRRAAAEVLSKEATTHLEDLALGSARVDFRFEVVDPGAKGADGVTLLFSSEESLEPGPIGSVASGGELSRLVLALRLAARQGGSGTLVFDEVDSGIGGVTALAMGAKLADLARDNQVLCVTHLPQVAAHADTHYVVERNDGKAEVRQVSDTDRLQELSRMLAGLPESEGGHQAASELLEAANR